MQQVKIIECPRDAMQGWPHPIPTQQKIEYINQLLQVGFDTIDFGSFVSARAIPQMADTAAVLEQLSLDNTPTKLLAIIANTRGAQEAASFDAITYLGFPFSISETFQQRNTNRTRMQALDQVREIQDICVKKNKTAVLYISMAFGNPYGDEYHEDMVVDWTGRLVREGVRIVSIADTVGIATAGQVHSVTGRVMEAFPGVETGIHLHSTHRNRLEKIDAALRAGCLRFDGALKGIGGCPMAGDELVGNMDTEWMIDYFRQLGIAPSLDREALSAAIRTAGIIFR